MKFNSSYRNTDSFTLVELLVVIGILAILTAAVVIVLNPAELLKQSRDSKRITDLANLDNALKLFIAQNPNVSLGSASTVYFSLPATNTDCSDVSASLPQIPVGWSFHCATAADITKTNGTGWIPVNFAASEAIASLSALPVNSSNNVNSYYMYVTRGGAWEFNAKLESLKYGLAHQADRVSTDGGDDFTRYEVGSDLTLSPWNFESTFTVAASNSNKPGWYQALGSGTTTDLSDSEGAFLRHTGYVFLVWQENIPFDPNVTYKISCKIRQITDPTVGAKRIFCGLAGVGANGVTLLNTTGADAYGIQHYHAVSGNDTLNAGAGWTEFIGYTKGLSVSDGTTGKCPLPTSPCNMQKDVKYIRPLMIINYNGGNGIADVDYFRIERQ